METKVTVSDTGPLLHLTEIGCSHLLTIFSNLMISPQVEAELVQYRIREHIKKVLGDHLTIANVEPHEIKIQQQNLTGFQIQLTDMSVVILTSKYKPEITLTDDLELRKVLEHQEHTVTGSIGILIRAFKTQRLTQTELITHLDQLFDDSTLYLSREFYVHVQNLINQHTI